VWQYIFAFLHEFNRVIFGKYGKHSCISEKYEVRVLHDKEHPGS
jgi:hypothetical protein